MSVKDKITIGEIIFVGVVLSLSTAGTIPAVSFVYGLFTEGFAFAVGIFAASLFFLNFILLFFPVFGLFLSIGTLSWNPLLRWTLVTILAMILNYLIANISMEIATKLEPERFQHDRSLKEILEERQSKRNKGE